MENRFGLKDLLMVVLLLGVIVMVGLAMTQYDRQYVVPSGSSPTCGSSRPTWRTSTARSHAASR